jgi:cob(I)alamin adenosyltransferase
MPSFFTRLGDDGSTGLLGKGRVPKYDLRIEVLGTLDEATAAIGLGRAFCLVAESSALLLKIQQDLYHLMSEVAATPENVEKFHVIDHTQIAWLEEQTEALGQAVTVPREFILPGDTQAGAAIDLARTVVRRAERRMADLLQRGEIANDELLRYLNRLSSFLFVLELRENQAAGKTKPTLAKA